MMYLDIGWMRGGVANSQKKTQSVLPTANTDYRMTECSISDNLSDVSWVHKALAVQKDCTTPPHIYPTSSTRYVIARDQFYQAFPHLSTTSNKRWGEKAWA